MPATQLHAYHREYSADTGVAWICSPPDSAENFIWQQVPCCCIALHAYIAYERKCVNTSTRYKPPLPKCFKGRASSQQGFVACTPCQHAHSKLLNRHLLKQQNLSICSRHITVMLACITSFTCSVGSCLLGGDRQVHCLLASCSA